MQLEYLITRKGAIFDGKAEEIMNKSLEAAMYEAVALLEGEVKKITPKGVMGAQGGLLSTIHGEVTGKGTPVLKGIVGEQSKYGEVIEKGRAAGEKMPPGSVAYSSVRKGDHGTVHYVGGLLRWIEVKLGVDTETARKLEWPIRKKISKRGFKGTFMFKKAFDANLSKIQDIFDKHGFEVTRKLNE